MSSTTYVEVPVVNKDVAKATKTAKAEAAKRLGSEDIELITSGEIEREGKPMLATTWLFQPAKKP